MEKNKPLLKGNQAMREIGGEHKNLRKCNKTSICDMCKNMFIAFHTKTGSSSYSIRP